MSRDDAVDRRCLACDASSDVDRSLMNFPSKFTARNKCIHHGYSNSEKGMKRSGWVVGTDDDRDDDDDDNNDDNDDRDDINNSKII